MQALIIDDEPSLRESTATLLSIYCPDIEVVGTAGGVKQAISLIKAVKPDLIFLDVEMPDGTGFDVIHAFPERDFAVIFITGHNEYAIKAFKFSAIDYILKPLDPDDLERAVKKARQSFNPALSAFQLSALQSNLEKSKPNRIVLKDANHVYLVEVDEIIRCESDDNYTRFFLTDNRSILISTTLKDYENLLAAHHFFRCHQSHLVNLRFFSKFDKREGGSMHLKDGNVLPVSTRKREQLMKILETL